MTRVQALMSVVGGLVCVASPALGASASDPAQSGGPMWFSVIQFGSSIVVFLIVFFVLRKAAWPKILKGLEDREAKIRSEIYAAEEARKSAQAAQESYKREIEQARQKAADEIEKARAESSRMAADLRVKAEAEITELRDNAARGIEAAKRAAINEIYAEAANLATAVAGKILQREVNPGDQKRLVEESMAEVSARYAKA